jgi:hypothetical protein
MFFSNVYPKEHNPGLVQSSNVNVVNISVYTDVSTSVDSLSTATAQSLW